VSSTEVPPSQPDVTKLDESYKKDSSRWTDSYLNHSGTALHLKAVAALANTNGHTTQHH
jgi:hypothetical protein